MEEAVKTDATVQKTSVKSTTIKVTVGTHLKFNIHLDPISGIRKTSEPFEPEEGVTLSEDGKSVLTHMSGMKFKATFSAGRSVAISKENMVKEDDDNYICVVDTAKTGTGKLRCRMEVLVPDDDAPDLERKEVLVLNCGVQIEA